VVVWEKPALFGAASEKRFPTKKHKGLIFVV
jgi:hypothetical protein